MSTLPSSLRIARRTALASAALVLLAACGGDSPTAPRGPVHGLRLTNNSERTIEKVYVSPCTSPTWGDNQLSSPLAPSAVKVFPVSASGCYDVRAVATYGHSWRRDDVNVQGTTGVQVQ